MPLGLEWDGLHVAMTASRTIIPELGEPQTAQLVSETQMPQGDLTAVMDVHRASAQWTQAILGTALELPMEQVHLSIGCSRYDFRLVIVEAYQ